MSPRRIVNAMIRIGLLFALTQASYALSAHDIAYPSIEQLKQLHKNYASSHKEPPAISSPLKSGVG